MALATVEDVATAYKAAGGPDPGELSAADSATVAQALDIVSAQIKSYMGQNLELVTDEVVTLRYPGRWYFYPSRFLSLPERPIVSVTTVVNDDTTITDYEIWDEGNLWRESGWGDVVVVTYTHGYAEIPDDIRGVCISAVIRGFDNPEGYTNRAAETYSKTYETSSGLSDDEKATLDLHSSGMLV